MGMPLYLKFHYFFKKGAYAYLKAEWFQNFQNLFFLLKHGCYNPS